MRIPTEGKKKRGERAKRIKRKKGKEERARKCQDEEFGRERERIVGMKKAKDREKEKRLRGVRYLAY